MWLFSFTLGLLSALRSCHRLEFVRLVWMICSHVRSKYEGLVLFSIISFSPFVYPYDANMPTLSTVFLFLKLKYSSWSIFNFVLKMLSLHWRPLKAVCYAFSDRQKEGWAIPASESKVGIGTVRKRLSIILMQEYSTRSTPLRCFFPATHANDTPQLEIAHISALKTCIKKLGDGPQEVLDITLITLLALLILWMM